MSQITLDTDKVWDIGKASEATQKRITELSEGLQSQVKGLSHIEDFIQLYDERIQHQIRRMKNEAQRCGMAASYIFKIAEHYERTDSGLAKGLSILAPVLDKTRVENDISAIKESLEIHMMFYGTENYVRNYIFERLNNSTAQKMLDDGKAVVFFIEGAGQIPNGLDSKGKETRVGALCVVIKKVNGVPTVVFETNRCSTLPDYPTDASRNDGSAVPTVKDGMHYIRKTIHGRSDKYSALHIYSDNEAAGYSDVIRYTDSKNTSANDSASAAINIHHRSKGWGDGIATTGIPNSQGCFTFSSDTNGSFTTYDKFIEAVTGQQNASKTRYSGNENVGIIFVDRDLAVQNGTLERLYGKNAKLLLD